MSKKDNEKQNTQSESPPVERDDTDDRITVYWGMEKISPVQYNSFEIGGLHYTTKVKPGEDPEDAFNRAYSFLEKMARQQFEQKSKGFLARLMKTREHAKSLSKK